MLKGFVKFNVLTSFGNNFGHLFVEKLFLTNQFGELLLDIFLVKIELINILLPALTYIICKNHWGHKKWVQEKVVESVGRDNFHQLPGRQMVGTSRLPLATCSDC